MSGIISDASYATYLLTHWGRDRATGRFDLGWLVKRQTSDTARAVGLADRGVVAPGKKADLNVIDFDKLKVARPKMALIFLPAASACCKAQLVTWPPSSPAKLSIATARRWTRCPASSSVARREHPPFNRNRRIFE